MSKGSLFGLLNYLRPERPTRADTVLVKIGRYSAQAAVIGFLIAQLLASQNMLPTLAPILRNAALLSMLVYILTIVPVGIRVAGEHKGIKGAGAQTKDAFKHIFLYLFLPAAIFTALMLVVMWRMGTLGR